MYSQENSYLVTQARKEGVLLLVVTLVAMASFILLPWTTEIYHSASEAASKTNADAPSGFSILQRGATYPFADSPGVIVAAIGLCAVLSSLVIGYVIPKYYDLLSILRFLVAALIIIGCVIAAYYLINRTSNSLRANFQNNTGNSAMCVFGISESRTEGGYCLPVGVTRIMPNYGFVIMIIAVLFLLLKSQFPSPSAIKDAVRSLSL